MSSFGPEDHQDAKEEAKNRMATKYSIEGEEIVKRQWLEDYQGSEAYLAQVAEEGETKLKEFKKSKEFDELVAAKIKEGVNKERQAAQAALAQLGWGSR